MIATDIEARDMLVACGVPVATADTLVEHIAMHRDEQLAVITAETDAILKLGHDAVRERDQLAAQVSQLEDRQQEHLKLIAKLTRETPYPADLDECKSARAALIAEVGTLRSALDRCVEDKQRLAAQLDTKTVAIAAFAEAVARADSALLSRGRGGQQVSFHGDFAGANPGVLVCLGRWVALLQRGDS